MRWSECRWLKPAAVAVGGVQRVLDLVGGDAQRRRLIAIDVDVDLRIGDLEIAGDVLQQLLELGSLRSLASSLGASRYSSSMSGALQGELILALGELPADANRRQVLRKGIDARNRRQLAAAAPGSISCADLRRFAASGGRRSVPALPPAAVDMKESM